MLHLIFFCLYVFNLSASQPNSNTDMVTVVTYLKLLSDDNIEVGDSCAAGGGAAMGQHNCQYPFDRIQQRASFSNFVNTSLIEKMALSDAGFLVEYKNYSLMPKGFVENTNSNVCVVMVKIDASYPSEMHQMFLNDEIARSGLEMQISNYDLILDDYLKRKKNSWMKALKMEPINQQNRQNACLTKAQHEEAERRKAELRAAEEEQRMEAIRQRLEGHQESERTEARAIIEEQEAQSRLQQQQLENNTRIKLGNVKQQDLEKRMERIKLKENLAKNKQSDNLNKLRTKAQNSLIQIRSELRGFPSSAEYDAMIKKIDTLLGLILPGNDKKSLKNIQAIAAQADSIEERVQEIKLILFAEQQHQDQQQSVVAGSSEAGGGAASVATQVTPAIVVAVAHNHVEADKPMSNILNSSSDQAADCNHLKTETVVNLPPLCNCLQHNPAVLGLDRRCTYCMLSDYQYVNRW